MVMLSQSTFASGIFKTLTLSFITLSCICALVYMGHMNDHPHHKRNHHRARRRHHGKNNHSGDANASHHNPKNDALQKAIHEVNNIHGSENKALEKEMVNNLEALKAKAGYVYIDKGEKNHVNNGNEHHEKKHDDDHEDDDEDFDDDDDEDDDDEDEDYDYDSHFIHDL